MVLLKTPLYHLLIPSIVAHGIALFVYSKINVADTIPLKVVFTSPADFAKCVNIKSHITVTFSKIMDSTTVSNSTFFLEDSVRNPVAATVSYSAKSRTATLIPSASLIYNGRYNLTVKGGTTPHVIKDNLGIHLPADFVWKFTASPPPEAPPDEGTGGPILVISSALNPFSRYPVEILRAQGYNGFEAKDMSELTTNVLDSFDVVVLGDVNTSGLPSGLPDSDLTILTKWINAGGTLVALHPDITNTGLMNLLGITPTGSTISDGYVLVDTSRGKPGAGIVGQTIQFHGAADIYNLSGATSLATLYSNAATTANHPAVTMKSVGINGGKTIAFAYDLAKSVILTRQGNLAWAGVSRDGQAGPIRSDNLFFPSYIDFSKIQIPQADEQQHLLTNIILLSNLHKKPMPHLWFLPNGYKAAIVMTGDDHNLGIYPGSTGTELRFNEYMSMAPNDSMSLDNWISVRGTSYIFNYTPIHKDSTVYYQNQGFEIALHPTTDGLNFSNNSLNSALKTGLYLIHIQIPTMSSPVSIRMHCLPWSDWASQPKIENTLGIRFDENYYYWPGSWVQNRPGMFTGSGLPMRFADADGTIIDCYQSPSVITDESQMDIPFHVQTLLDNAVRLGYYGVFSVNMHTDTAIHIGSNQIIAAAQQRKLPVVSAKQMLNWLDNRNGTKFGPMKWVNSQLSFTVTTIAHHLQIMVPFNSATGSLMQVTENGLAHSFTQQTIKGISYGVFAASTNSYVATYSSSPLPSR
jgi:hypothetical protein